MPTLTLYLFALFSGFAALVYQVAWSRMLSLTFGSSTLAVSAVVAGFMGGMGLGAWAYHRLADRIDSSIRAYGLLEIGIVVSTAALTILYAGLPELFAGAASVVPAGAPMTLFRIATAFVLLLLPAALMGGTYPALCRVMLRTSSEVDARLGWIYGLNTVGAALGAIVAGLVLVEAFGSTGAVRVANFINLVIGLASLWLARRLRDAQARAPSSDETLESPLPHWLTGLVLFGSGFATLGYEIVWFRALHYLLGPGTYTLSALLAIFLLGLGLGGCLYRPVLRFRRPAWALGFGQLGIALFAILAVGAEHLILTDPDLSRRFSLLATAASRPWQDHLADAATLAAMLMLPATLWMGVVFPLASRLFLGPMSELTSRVGQAYLLSNLGSIAGGILAAVWILPTLGTLGGTKLLVAVNLLLGLMVLARASTRAALGVGAVISLAIAGIGLALPERFAFGVASDSLSLEILLEFEEESDLGTVQVYSRRGDDRRAMVIDGVIVSATESWSRDPFVKQIALAHLPLQLDWRIRKTLNLGVAGGSTLATLAQYPQLDVLDAVEINGAVIRGGRRFEDWRVLEDPRVDVILEDAVHYLLTTDRRYDLIINDAKEQVRFGGNAKILSQEFYRYALGSLNECGLFAQAIGLSRDPESLGLILRTVLSVFPEVEVFLVSANMSVVVGSRCPIAGREQPSPSEIEAAGVGREIRRYFSRDATDLASLWIGSGSELRKAIGPGPVNDWNFLPFEFMSYRSPLATKQDWAASLRLVLEPRLAEDDPGSSFSESAAYESLRKTHRAFLMSLEGDVRGAQRLIREVLRESPRHPMARHVEETIKALFYSPR